MNEAECWCGFKADFWVSNSATLDFQPAHDREGWAWSSESETRSAPMYVLQYAYKALSQSWIN